MVLIMGLVRAPLVHFLLLGAGIYFLYGLVGSGGDPVPDNRITVSAGEVAWLEESFAKRWNRGPTASERRGLLDEYIRESVLYREALAMGLDRDDTIVRRRLAQKLEFLTQDLLQPSPPSEAELRAFFDAGRDRYQELPRVTFTHEFIDADRRGSDVEHDVAEILARLQELGLPGAATEPLGDPFMLQRYYPERDGNEIAKLFGREFAEAIFVLVPGQWHGPVVSGYGLHLVYVHARSEPAMPEFDDVRARVEEDWLEARRTELNTEFYTSLRDRYEIVIEDEIASEEVAGLEGQP